ncbi:MAG: hypothetical protein HY784_01295 [Chloroflexi bacterium]|nr:hypothetical protein [Chloroflexota bacterium]
MTDRVHFRIPPQIAAIAPDGNLTLRQRRRLKLDMVLRRHRPGTGSSAEFLQRRTAIIEWPDLRDILKDIPWVLIGGVATRAYMPERMTRDMEVLVHRRGGEEAHRRLVTAGYTVLSRLIEPGFVLRSPEGAEVDLIYGDYPWLDHALAHPEFDAAGYPVIGLPYLILLKLWATRDQDWTDITRMLSTASDEQIDKIRAVVARHSPEPHSPPPTPHSPLPTPHSPLPTPHSPLPTYPPISLASRTPFPFSRPLPDGGPSARNSISRRNCS